MTCTCTFHSPFLWADHPRESRFASDPVFVTGAKSGKTMSQIQSANIERITRETGINPGTVKRLSAHADRLIEEARKRRRA